MSFAAKIFTFEEKEDGVLVRDLYLKEIDVPEFRRQDSYLCESAHKEYKHVGKEEATLFESQEDAEKAIEMDTANGGWSRIHDAYFWPRIKRVLHANGLWGCVEKV